MDGVSAVLESIGSSICNMTAEHKLRQLQQDACADAQAVQATKVLASSPQRRHEAMHHLQQTETHLDPDCMITHLRQYNCSQCIYVIRAGGLSLGLDLKVVEGAWFH